MLQGNLHLSSNGTLLKLEQVDQALEFPPGQGGLQTLRLTAHLVAKLPPSSSAWKVDYRDQNYAERLGWQEIIVRTNPDVTLLESTAPMKDVSQELRNYPQDLLTSPLAVSAASFRFGPKGSGGFSVAAIAIPGSGSRSGLSISRGQDRFAELVTLPTLGLGALLITLLAAFGWGALHAFTPGHGKTVVAAYLVGSRGTVPHALFLGVTTTVTHTAGVFVFGLLTLFASQFILPEQLYPWLGVASGALVVAIGLSLFRARLLSLFQPHQHHDHGHSHDDEHPHDHEHEHDHTHTHPHLPPGADGAPITWRGLLALGISGGLLPCPSALVVMLSAIAFQRIGFGLVLIVAFSLGLASVLTAIGILFVHAGRLFGRIPLGGRLAQAVPVLSALFITAAGVFITFEALIQAGVLRA
jgi:ABC-type nickel/cobalt efflux system permease component RcnA